MVTGRGSDEALLREWLEAVRNDIELPALGGCRAGAPVARPDYQRRMAEKSLL